jgi:hypothetical protein
MTKLDVRENNISEKEIRAAGSGRQHVRGLNSSLFISHSK